MPVLPFGSAPTPSATSTKLGKVQLAGDLAGTATAPTIKSSVALAGSPTTTTQATGDNSSKIATDAFVATAVANAIAGVNPAVAVAAATVTKLPTSPTYNNGASGIGATITAGSNNTALTVDGFTFTTLGQRILVKDEASGGLGAADNGIYYVTQLQASLLPWILTRALDYDQASDINSTGAIPVVNGTANTLTSWLLTSQVTTVGTDPLTYTEFSVNPTSILLKANNLSDVANPTTSFNNIVPNIVTGASVGSGSLIPVITFDNTGRITAASTSSVVASTQRSFAFFIG